MKTEYKYGQYWTPLSQSDCRCVFVQAIMFTIARRKDNQTMKFGLIEEYNTRNIFLENHIQNMMERLLPDPFMKNQHRAYLWISSLKCNKFDLLYVQVEVYQNILKLRCWPLAFTLHKAFLKDGVLELVSLLHFLNAFCEKIFLTLYSTDWPSFIVWLSLLLAILGRMCIVIIFCPACEVTEFEINPNLLIKSFFYITKRSIQKCKYLKNEISF